MTKELVYQGSLIRIEQAEGESVTPVADIAKAIGYDPRVLSKMVRRDPVLHLYEVSVTNPSQMPTGGYFQRKNNCLKKEGVAGLLVKLNSSRIKDAEKRDKVQASKFRRKRGLVYQTSTKGGEGYEKTFYRNSHIG